jgi:hypothetical protein
MIYAGGRSAEALQTWKLVQSFSVTSWARQSGFFDYAAAMGLVVSPGDPFLTPDGGLCAVRSDTRETGPDGEFVGEDL